MNCIRIVTQYDMYDTSAMTFGTRNDGMGSRKRIWALFVFIKEN